MDHGPILHTDDTTTFRLWAPDCGRVELVCNGRSYDVEALDRGWHRVRIDARAGDRYGFRPDGGDVLPDPASRHQPEGVHAQSAVIDTGAFPWSDEEADWRPAPLSAAVFYELHVGTFTSEGTFSAAAAHLDELRALGVTHVEVMPVAAFNGPRGWGYDGVAWYAVHEPYGGPQAFAGFVEACHRAGLAVCLDVVYNHLGPSGNVLPTYGPYLTDRYDTPWGEALNLDGPGSDAVRRFIVGNALMWLSEYHVDALRLDAVHGLIDTSAVHVLAQLADEVRDLESRAGRPKQLIAESDRQDPRTVRPRAVGGLGLDGQWADELHHAIHVALTGERDGYYAEFRGLPDVAAAYQRGFVFDGRYSPRRGRTIGAPLGDVPGWRLVACLQNHDQVGNRAAGDRLTTVVDPASLRMGIALLCAAPITPLLFMGDEYGETNPFCYFTSHPEPELAKAVRDGRRREFAAFTGFAGTVPDPQDETTFAASVLDRSRVTTAAGQARRALWRDLLALRRSEPALTGGRRDRVEVLHVTADVLLVLRRHPAGRSILVGANRASAPARLTTDLGGIWSLRWSSDDPRYGGDGGHAEAAQTTSGLEVTLPARSCCLLAQAPECAS